MAAHDDMHEPVVEAQTALAFFYSRQNSDFYDLKKALYWHNQASRNGSLESLGSIMIVTIMDLHYYLSTFRSHGCDESIWYWYKQRY